MKITETDLAGVLIIEPQVFKDTRGFFFEAFHGQRYAEHGINVNFVQDNFSRSTQGVLRGLHYQLTHQQGKLVWITRGKIFDVVVDVRRGSPTFGKSLITHLSEDQPRQIYIPPGLAHGFCVLSEQADFCYKCSDYHHPGAERGIIWNDPSLQIPWPVTNPVLSSKDQLFMGLQDINPEELPRYESK